MKPILILFAGMILLFLPYFSFAVNASGSLEYRVVIREPHTHYFEVEIKLKNPQAKHVDLKLPVWTPGSYMVREYAANVEGFQAVDLNDNTSLNFTKLNKSTWRVALKTGSDIAIRYRVYAFAGSTRMSYLDEEHAFIMANTLLMYTDELRSTSSILKLEYPDAWNAISTSLTAIEGSENSFYVPDYDILVDSPIEIGNHEIINFNTGGVDYEIALVGKVQFDREQLVRDLKQIVESATTIFEDNPNEKYTFIIHTDRWGGGLEHSSSTVIGVDRYTFINEKKYHDFLGLAAHEYFHLWMVKRLKPVELKEIDYEKEVYTDLLWVMEGFAEYYEKKIMLDCGFFYQMAVLSNLPGSGIQSVADASFDTWIKYYRRNENSDNTQVSYYRKGLVLAALLDLQIIYGSEGEKSLDDVVSNLYYQFYKKKDKGIVNEDLKRACERDSGADLDEFFNDYVYGTKPLNNTFYLDLAGISLVETNKDMSTKSLGLSYTDRQGRLIVSAIRRGGAAYEFGLNTGDELIAINDYRIDKTNYQLIVNSFKEGDRVRVLLARRGLVLETELVIRYDDSVKYTYKIQENRSKRQLKTYSTWIGK
jgi:predicted metalloprotease with PDZ domain